MSKNLSHLAGRKGLNYNLFEELGIAAKEKGSPTLEEIEKLRQEFLMGSANIYGTVSFYDFLKEDNKGKKVYVCNGTSCLTARTQNKVKDTLSQYFEPQQIGEMCCLGRCHENSAFHYDGINYSGDDINSFQHCHQQTHEKYNVAHIGTPVITQSPDNWEEYIPLLKSCLAHSPQKWIDELKISLLRGRGGAGFPISFKLQACRETESETKFIVCNADEGDPGAYSDRYIMEQKPYSLLAGMMMAGYIVGAEYGVLYVRAEYPESVERLYKAIENIAHSGGLGDNIHGHPYNFRFKIIKAQGAYICGEETALLSSIEGQRPEVRVRPPYPTQQGLFNQPTVVNNVETLACIPYVIKNGGDAFSKIGKGRSTGTKLISLDGYFCKPGIYEVDMGVSLRKVIYDLGGGFKQPVKAMHIGGPLGGLVPISKIDDLTIDFESFSSEGFLLGHASIVCVPENFPIIEYIKHLFQFTAHESCGKCFPCRLGSTRGYEMVDKAINTSFKINRELLEDLLETLEIGSLCALGGGLPLPIKNALEYFGDELADYLE